MDHIFRFTYPAIPAITSKLRRLDENVYILYAKGIKVNVNKPSASSKAQGSTLGEVDRKFWPS